MIRLIVLCQNRSIRSQNLIDFKKNQKFLMNRLVTIYHQLCELAEHHLVMENGAATNISTNVRNPFISNPLESPSPDRYELKLGFDSLITSSKVNSHNKSFCFATGREAYDRVFMPGKSN